MQKQPSDTERHSTPPPPLPEAARYVGMGLGMGMGMGMGYGGHMGGWGYGYLMPPFPPVGAGPPLRPPLFAHRPPFPPNGENDFNYNHSRGFKRLGGPSYDNPRPYSRGRPRSRSGYGGHHWGYHGRGHGPGHRRDLLTKEALDADLDQWRMKDKKSAGESLDADLDEYWKRKNDGSEQVQSECKDSSTFEKRDSSDVPVPKRAAGSGSSLRPSKTMRSTLLDSQD